MNHDSDRSIPPLANGLAAAEILTACMESFNLGSAHEQSWTLGCG